MAQDLFQSPDYFNVDELLSDEQKLIRETVRSYVKKEISPIIEDYAQKAEFPQQIVKQLGELGCFGPTISEEYGGGGLDYISYGLMMQELERGDSGVRSTASVQGSLVMFPIFAYGSEEQRKKYLPKLASGEWLGCFGLTEPNHGSNPGGMRTRAKKDGGDYILNGEKMWITSGTLADVAIIWAKVDDEDGRIRGFLVDTKLPGFSAYDVHGKWSLRASVTSGLSMQDVRVPASALLPGSGGLKSPLMCLNQARYGISWGALGAAMSCYDTALQYSLLRKQFRDEPIASHQLIQEELAWMISEITKAQLLSLQVGRMKDAKMADHQHISMAKRNNVWMALECARKSRDILGANGITDDYPVMRHMLNLESVKTYEGTHNMHTLIIGQSVTGIPAY